MTTAARKSDARKAARKKPASRPAARTKKAAAKPAANAKKPAAKAGKKTTPAQERLFGTDGIRTVAGRGPLRPEGVLAVGRALGRFLVQRAEEDKRPLVLLGVDPRPSSDLVGTALASGLVSECCDVHWPGMMSTPEVAFLVRHGPFHAGISVTASHNPAGDNGIKIFGRDGRKLPDAVERRLERDILSGRASGDADPAGGRFGWLQLGRERHYEEFILKTFRASFAKSAKRSLGVVMDCAFGARSIDLQIVSQLARSVTMGRTVPALRTGMALRTSGKHPKSALDVWFMNAASPTRPEEHHLINDGVGSLHPESCAAAVRELKADLGICFDGDGDRCILVDEKGTVRDGDHILALLAADMKAGGALPGNVVVSTVMANYGLERALGALGIELVRTDVGDRNVFTEMQKRGATLGGEQSGHILIADEGHEVGDGLYTALRVIEVMLETGRPLSDLCRSVHKYPQLLVNVRVKDKPPLSRLKGVASARREAEKMLAGRGRMVLRYSGTEPLLRVMAEGDDETLVQGAVNLVAHAAKKEIG